MTWANLNGEPVISARVTIPYIGRWVADVTLAISSPVPQRNTLTLGDLVLQGSTWRVDDFAGQRTARLMGGAGGWHQTVPQRTYANAGGLLLSLVLNNLAGSIGETMVIAQDRSVGVAFVREAGPASNVLRQLAPQWWVAPDGTTHTGARDASPITSHFDIIMYEGGRGKVNVATEVLSDWMPGRVFSAPTLPGPLTISSVTHIADNEGTSRAEILASATGDRVDAVLGGLRAIDAGDDVPLFGFYEYAVQSSSGDSVVASPVDPTLPLDTVQAPIWGTNGATAQPSSGSVGAVFFLNGDRTKPRFMPGPDAREVDVAAAAGTVVRDGDVVSGPWAGGPGPISLISGGVHGAKSLVKA